jgi:hypothetical protein
MIDDRISRAAAVGGVLGAHVEGGHGRLRRWNDWYIEGRWLISMASSTSPKPASEKASTVVGRFGAPRTPKV